MWLYGVLAGLVIVSGALLLLLGPRGATRARAAPSAVQVAQAAPADSRPAAKPLGRAELTARLKELARSAPPKELSMGAMCYDMAGPPETADYVCPKCGQRTQYSQDGELTMLVAYELQAMREQMKALPGLEATLDEAELCRKCSPSATRPELVLRVRYPEPTGSQLGEHRVRGVRPQDLRLLQEFLSGKTKHAGEQGQESPLKDHLPRLQELLGTPR
jgi:hypothetical protein